MSRVCERVQLNQGGKRTSAYNVNEGFCQVTEFCDLRMG